MFQGGRMSVDDSLSPERAEEIQHYSTGLYGWFLVVHLNADKFEQQFYNYGFLYIYLQLRLRQCTTK